MVFRKPLVCINDEFCTCECTDACGHTTRPSLLGKHPARVNNVNVECLHLHHSNIIYNTSFMSPALRVVVLKNCDGATAL